MKKSEVLRLLTIASAFDNRRPTDEQVDAWFAVIGDLDYGDAAAAVREHFRESTAWMLPGHVVAGVRAIEAARAWDPPVLTAAEAQLCAAAGVPAEEFVHRRDDAEWVAHLRTRWLGVET